MKAVTKSWKTTIGGLITAIGSSILLIDASWANTVAPILMAIGSFLAGSSARDSDVSSQESGAR